MEEARLLRRGLFNKFLDNIQKSVEAILNNMASGIEKRVSDGVLNNLAPVKNPKRRAAILVDFENVDRNVSAQNWLQDFHVFIETLLDQCEIDILCVFVPAHMVGLMPIRTFSNMHRFFPIVCPPTASRDDRGGFINKDTDTVDARMDQFGKFIIARSDITDLVVVTGDGGFQELLKFAEYHQKIVTLISPADAVSGRFLLQQREFNLKLLA